MAITIDWGNAIINVPRADMALVQTSPTEIRELDLNDFRTLLKALEGSQEGMGFQKILDHYTAIQVGGVDLAHVLVLLAPYTVTFEDGQYAVNLIGANSNVGDRVNVNQVSVRSANSAGLAQTKDIEFASFGSAVHIDDISGNDLNKGNEQYPVKTVARAVEVLNYRGFRTVHLGSSMTFGPEAQFPACLIEGESKLTILLHVEPGANVDHCVFRNLTITGTLDQSAMLEGCVVENLEYVEGDIHNCEVTGVLKVAGSEGLEIFNSYSGRKGPSDPAVIDMDGPNSGGKNVAIHNWSGHIRIRNMTAGYLGIACVGGGHVRVESTCTGGMVHVMGNFKLINQAAGATVLTKYMTDPATIASTIRALSTTTPATSDTVGKQWELAAAGGSGGGGDASWSQALPNGFTEGQAGWILANVNDVVSDFQRQLQLLLGKSYQAGLVVVPTATEDGDDIVLYVGTDYDGMRFNLGPKWSSYLAEPNAEVWFTIKTSGTAKTPILDVKGSILDSVEGVMGLDLTGAQLTVPLGTFFWQVQIRGSSLPVEKRVAQEGVVYLKPTFK